MISIFVTYNKLIRKEYAILDQKVELEFLHHEYEKCFFRCKYAHTRDVNFRKYSPQPQFTLKDIILISNKILCTEFQQWILNLTNPLYFDKSFRFFPFSVRYSFLFLCDFYALITTVNNLLVWSEISCVTFITKQNSFYVVGIENLCVRSVLYNQGRDHNNFLLVPRYCFLNPKCRGERSVFY